MLIVGGTGAGAAGVAVAPPVEEADDGCGTEFRCSLSCGLLKGSCGEG